MDEFEYTHEFISNGGALRVSFRALSEKFIKPEECYVKISDLNTGLCIHYDKFTITKGINFHMDAFVSKDRLSGLLFEILDKKCDVIFQGIQDFGNNIGIYIDGKNYKLKTSLVDNIWWVFDEIFLKKVYEYNGIKVEKGDFVLDLGANYGVFSIYSLINGASEIYCVEPSNVTYSYLYDNIKMFNIIKPINCGVGSVTETRKFSLYYESSGGSTLYPTEQCTIDRMIEMVSIVNINQFLIFISFYSLFIFFSYIINGKRKFQ